MHNKYIKSRLPSFLARGFIYFVPLILILLLSAQNVFSAGVTLAWDANNEEDLDGYRVFCRKEGQSYDYKNRAWDGDRTETSCTINLNDNTTYYFVARAFDTSGNESGDSNEVCYQPNVPPAADDQSITTHEDIPIDIILTATDVDEGNLMYAVVGQPSHGTLSGTAPNLTYSPNVNYNGSDSFTFKANDGTVGSNIATVNITVNPVNDPPIADAGPDQTVDEEATVTLNAFNSADPDDGIAAYLWTQTGGTSVTLSDVNAVQPTFTSPDVGPQGASLTFQLRVTDNGALQSTDMCTVVVRDIPKADTDGDGIPDDDEVNIYNTDPNKADTDGDGINDGDELAFWGADWDGDYDNDGLINILDADSDNDGFSDGMEIESGFDPADPESGPELPCLEIGEVSVDHNWKLVEFSESFHDPVVVARSLSCNEGDPAVVRIRNADASGFEIRVQEWDYLDGIHAEETLCYIVMERGTYILPDGTMVEAERFETDRTASFEEVAFSRTFQAAPVVITAISSYNEADAVTTRVRNISINGFELRMQEQELNSQTHDTETISYIAWEPSSGTMDDLTYEVKKTDDVVTDGLHTIVYNETFMNIPVFLADMQTTDGEDTASVRWQDKDFYGLDVKIVEEQSGDSETSHTTEVVGYMLFSRTRLASEEVIIDNGDAGTSSTGRWYVSMGGNPYGDNSLFSYQAGATYTFEAPVDGSYEVSLWWTERLSRCTSVPVEIYDGHTLLDTIEVNQKANGGQWNVLGTYDFTGTASVVIISEGRYSTCADAVRFVSPEREFDHGEIEGPPERELDHVEIEGPLSVNENSSADYNCTAYYTNGTNQLVEPDTWAVDSPHTEISAMGLMMTYEVSSDESCQISASYTEGGITRTDTHDITIRDFVPPSEVIIDNGDAGTSSTGRWYVSGGGNPYGDNSLSSYRAGATYTFEAPVVGLYEVSLWWTERLSRCTSVPVEIYDGHTLLDTIEVNQKADGGQWNVVGTYVFNGIARVLIISEGGRSTCADAVRFVSSAW